MDFLEVPGENFNKLDQLKTQFILNLNVSESTINIYKREINQFFSYLYMNGITEPKRTDILAYKNYLSNVKKLKPTTIQNYIIAVRQFYNFLEQEYNIKNVAKGIKGAKISRNHKRDILSTEQIKTLIRSINGHQEQDKRDKAIILLMVTTALRTVEVSRANIEDLRLTNGKYLLFVQGKGHTQKDTPVVITKEVYQAIINYLDCRTSRKQTEPLFTSTSNNSLGQAITTRTISAIIKQRLKNIGIDSPRITAHSLRHTAITSAYKSMKKHNISDSLSEVQQFARHKNPLTTQIYIHEVNQADNIGSQLITETLSDLF